MNNIKAISFSDYKKNGCVNCGCDTCLSNSFSNGGCVPVTCAECDEEFIILADGLNKSLIGFMKNGNNFVYPKKTRHPRAGIPAHLYIPPDIRPKGEGEYFNSRGIGYDLAGFVKSKSAGERILKMFEDILNKKPSTWLDFRKDEPKRIQIKVSKDDVDLQKLDSLVNENGIITKEKIIKAFKAKNNKNMIY